MRLLPSLLLLGAALSAHAAPATPALTVPAPDLAALQAGDVAARESAARRPVATRVAVAVPMASDSASTGEWRLEDEQRVWRLDIHAPGARMVGATLMRTRLPTGAQLQASGENGHSLTLDTSGADTLHVPPVPGERLRLELRIAADAEAYVALETLDWFYRDLAGNTDASFKRAGSCNIDVACALGDTWQDQIRSVARYTLRSSTKEPDDSRTYTYLCTGQLVNNTAQNGRRLFLTANHCVETNEEAATLIFYFNDELQACGGSQSRATTTVTGGANLLMARSDNDISLLEIRSAIPATANAHLAGWDSRDLAPVDVVTIHHPDGDWKKISRANSATSITRFSSDNSSGPTGDRRFLRIPFWSQGTTEAGSSGAGLWTTDRRVTGVLSGGFAACNGSLPNAQPDWYGRLHTAWSGEACKALGPHLDPVGSGTPGLDGRESPSPTAVAAATPCTTPPDDGGNGPGVGFGDDGGAPASLVLMMLGLLGAAAAWRRRPRA